MRSRHHVRVLVTVLLVLATVVACAGDPGPDDDPSTPVDADADDPADPEAPVDPDTSWEDFDVDAAVADAHGVLGMYERDLPGDVRISRRGEETFALTEDYVLGRRTVELDDLEGDGYRVTSVVVELPDGPETLVLQGG